MRTSNCEGLKCMCNELVNGEDISIGKDIEEETYTGDYFADLSETIAEDHEEEDLLWRLLDDILQTQEDIVEKIEELEDVLGPITVEKLSGEVDYDNRIEGRTALERDIVDIYRLSRSNLSSINTLLSNIIL